MKTKKNILLTNHPFSIWLTGLSCSGKTTVAMELSKLFAKSNCDVTILDGDELRHGVNSDLGFSLDSRRENIRRAAEISKLFLNSGITTINAFICPTEELRNLAASIVGTDSYIEIWLNSPLEVCEQRDVKGLYKKARLGKIPDFTGINSSYETPVNCHLEINTDKESPEKSANRIFEFILNYLCRI